MTREVWLSRLQLGPFPVCEQSEAISFSGATVLRFARNP